MKSRAKPLPRKRTASRKLPLPRLPWIDISPAITEQIAVFPGDQPYQRRISLDFKKGDHLLLSSVQSTLHLGAHADGPNHYSSEGVGIGERSLDFYYGPCQVLRLNLQPGERIFPQHLGKKKILAPRILFRTDSFPDPNQWTESFNSLSPELIEDLADKGVALVGIDTPSVDPATSRSLESHQALRRRNLAVLEGIDLRNVSPGLYRLIALPLRLLEGDASPVRAVLLPEKAKR